MLGAASILTLALAGTPALSESLADALVMAYRTSPELASSRSNIKVLSERAVQARGLGRVQVQGSVNLDANFQGLDRFDFPSVLQLDVTQPLFTGGQVANSTEAAETRTDAEEARTLEVEQIELLNAVTAYMDVREGITLVAIARNSVRVIGEQLRAAQERFDVGEVTRTDVAQAESRLEASRATLAAAIGDLERSREAYLEAVGSYPGELDPPPPLPDLPETIEDAFQLALVGHPEILAARLEREASGSDVRSAIGALLPQIDLVGSLGRNDVIGGEFGSNDRQADAFAGVRITLPFYSGGINYSNVREAQADVGGRSADITSEMREAVLDVGTQWANLRVARAQIRAGVQQVRAAQIAFDGVSEEAKVGARTTLDVLDAEQELLDARATVVTAQRDEVVSAYGLLAAMGKLTVKHLGLDVEDPLPPGSYYAEVKERDFGSDQTDETVWSLSYRP